MRFFARVFAAFVFMCAVATAAHAESDKVALKFYPDKTAAVPGQSLGLAIEQTILDGWHTYWVNPGDSGEAMSIKWDLPEGYKASEFLWPAPERIPYGPLMNFGYREHAVVLTTINVPQDAIPGQMLAIKGRANVLVCDEICIPEAHDFALNVPIASAAQPANADLFSNAAARVPQPVDWHTITEVDANEVRVRITLPASETGFSSSPDDIIWLPRQWGYINNSSDSSAVFEPSTRTLTLRQGRDDTRNVNDLHDAGYLLSLGDRSIFISGDIKVMDSPVMGAPVMGVEGAAEAPHASLLYLVALAFVGGLILNLMPCVFPVLSMKALHLITLSSKERKHAQVSGVLYTAGVVSTFLALAVVLFAIRAAGAQLGWGFQLQNPAFVAGIAWLLFVTGLNLAGLFDLRIVFGGEILLAEKHHPHLTSYLTGVLATLVATPCSAPFMATALGAALVQPTPAALAIFAFVGLGLAAPYALLCFVPTLQKLLPRPGAWMATFRQALSFPMFASAVWLVWVVAQQGGPTAVATTLGGMVALAFAVWILDMQPKKASVRLGLTIAGILLIGAAISSLHLIVQKPGEGGNQYAQAEEYKAYTPEAFDHAINDTKKPVFVNMTASWCITCLVNEKVTLSTQPVQALFKTMDVTYFVGDWTNEDKAITRYLEKYGRSGVPLYVYYGAPNAETGRRPAPVILPQILTSETLFETIK